MELRAVRAETLAEVRALEIARLERLLAVPGAPQAGGFLPFEMGDEAESDTAEPVTDFMARQAEITDGLTLEEAERRWTIHREQQVAALRAEQADVNAELQTLRELD